MKLFKFQSKLTTRTMKFNEEKIEWKWHENNQSVRYKKNRIVHVNTLKTHTHSILINYKNKTKTKRDTEKNHFFWSRFVCVIYLVLPIKWEQKKYTWQEKKRACIFDVMLFNRIISGPLDFSIRPNSNLNRKSGAFRIWWRLQRESEAERKR